MKVRRSVNVTARIPSCLVSESQPAWPPRRRDLRGLQLNSLVLFIIDMEIELHDVDQTTGPDNTTNLVN